MRAICEVCGDYKICDEDEVCYDCRQDEADLEDWLPEDDELEEDV